MNSVYIVSPYLLKISNDRDFAVFNFLDSKIRHIDDNGLNILKYCKTPKTQKAILQHFPLEITKQYINEKLLLKNDTVWIQNNIQHVEIETSTVCNWKCEYCPNAHIPRKPQMMGLDLFRIVLQRAAEYGKVKVISINSYNEPTIDPLFYERLELIKKYKMRLLLYTNGSNLDTDKILYIKKLNILDRVFVHLPSLNQETFQSLTKSNDYTKTLTAIKQCLLHGLPVSISMQKHSKNIRSDAELLKKQFPGAELKLFNAADRSGTLQNLYSQNINIQHQYLSSCLLFSMTLNIGVGGDLFICCNDYNHLYEIGNVRNHNFESIMNCHSYTTLRKKIFGEIEAEPNFICRRCSQMSYLLKYKKIRECI